MAKILLVDDQDDFRKTMSGLLADAGHTVLVAANEGEAIALVAQEPFDFALIDVRLHGGEEEDESGLSLAMALRFLKPETRVVLLTRFVRTRQVVGAIRYLGVADFIEKTPDVGEQVLKTISRAEKEGKRLSFDKSGDSTRLSISLAKEQPLAIRARGRHVCSVRSLNNLKIDVERYARKTDIAERESSDFRFQVKEIGSELWHEIFAKHPEAARAYLEARAKSLSTMLLIEAPREFLRVPFEFMLSERPPEYLILQHPLARFVNEATPRREALSPQLLALTNKLKVLIIASNTEPLIPGVDNETRELSNYLKNQDRIPVDVKLIPSESATYTRVRDELRDGKYHIIHYAGHGSYVDESPEESSLYLWERENKQGRVISMKASELKILLDRSEARLAYFSSCYGTTTGGDTALLDDDFLGLADAAVQAGVPSVLGFRWPVSDKGAPKLALAFYQSLLEQGNPEIALWSARCELAALDRNDPTWLSPILIYQQ
jgi:ActR/RegA family two-component response regulator